jgi:hypothetical protein
MRPALATIALLMLGACHEAGRPAAPAPELPKLARATQTLAGRNGAAPLLVPGNLVVQRGGIAGVYVLRAGRARFQPVKLGRQAGGSIEALAGLEGGEKLVGGPLAEVRDGSPIRETGS